MTETLNRCPFCGSGNASYSNNHFYCRNCGAEGPYGKNQEDAYDGWQKRTPSEIPVVDVDYQEALRQIANGAEDPMDIAHIALQHGAPKREAQPAGEMLDNKPFEPMLDEAAIRLAERIKNAHAYIHTSDEEMAFIKRMDELITRLKNPPYLVGDEPKRESVAPNHCMKHEAPDVDCLDCYQAYMGHPMRGGKS